MTLTIELPEPLSIAFGRKAQQRGVGIEELARQLIEREAEVTPTGPFDDLLGVLEGRLPGVASFYAERSDETSRHEEQDETRF